MGKTKFFKLIFIISILIILTGQIVNDKKDIYRTGYPNFLEFRKDYNKEACKNYEMWKESILPSNGAIKKIINEELTELHPEISSWANSFSSEYPDKIMLLHLNGETRQTHLIEDVHKTYFPGHWIYSTGTFLTVDAEINEIVLHVKNSKLFREKAYKLHVEFDNKNEIWAPHDIIIVKLDNNGNKLWYESEYAVVKGIDNEKNTITVERAMYYSKPLKFKAGETYIAPLVADVWLKEPMWFYNISEACPKDKNGKTAGDVFSDEIKKWFSTGGKCEKLSGIAFDVVYFSIKYKFADTNNDGVPDGGIINGFNIWQKGCYDFLKKVRFKIGDDKIITSDGQMENNQTAVGILSGIESEGLVTYNDGYRGFSKPINIHTYWNQYNNVKNKFSYINLKLRSNDDLKNEVSLKRLGLGTALCLGIASTKYEIYNYILPDFIKGEENKINWLGKPVREMIRIAEASPNIYNWSKKLENKNFISSIRCENCSVSLSEKDEILIIKGKNIQSPDNMKITLPEINAPVGDLVIFFDITAKDPLRGFENNNLIPRKVKIKVEGLPVYETEKLYDSYHKELFGLFGTAGYSTVSFYFRNVNKGTGRLLITLEFEEQGKVIIKNLRMHNSPDVLAREFENGIVLVNPSYNPYKFDCRELFPDISGLKRIKAQEINLNELKKWAVSDFRVNEALKIINGFKKEYTGEAVKDLSNVIVPKLDALILIKK